VRVHLLFWFLFFAMPLLAVAFVVRVGLGLWRRARRAFGEIGDLSERVGTVLDEAQFSETPPSAPAHRR
jgi:hypothetical protein